MNKVKQAFTLVELIVVITILAILATISFISIQGFTKDARDSTRLADLKSIEKTLELFELTSGYYPEPTDGVEITYSGSEVWIQGVVGDSVIRNVSRLSEKPIDPLTTTDYTYSRLNTKQEYELGTIMEGDLSYRGNILNNANASGIKLAKAKIIGNYNGMLAKVHTGTIDYILAVPSIISTDLSDGLFINILGSNKISCSGYGKLPSSYNVSIFNIDGGIPDLNFVKRVESEIIVFEGNIENLKKDNIDGDILREELVTKLKTSYTGVEGLCNSEISKILSLDPSTSYEYNRNLVNKFLGSNLSLLNASSVTEECIFGTSTFGNCVLN